MGTSFAKAPYEIRSPHDLQKFFEILGMHPSEVKQSFG